MPEEGLGVLFFSPFQRALRTVVCFSGRLYLALGSSTQRKALPL